MKKMLLATLLATIAGFASAVTYTWDSTASKFKDANNNEIGAYTNITKLVITVTYQNTNTSAIAHDYFAIQSSTDATKGNIGMSVSDGSAKYWIKGRDGTILDGVTGGGHFSTARVNGTDPGHNTATFTFLDAKGDGTLNQMKVQHAFADGTGGTNNEVDQWSNRNYNFDGVVFDSLLVYKGASVSTATIEIEGTSVPEPTVLALLALGVAGVALRRRA